VIAFAANLAGTFVVSWLIASGAIVRTEDLRAMIEISGQIMHHNFAETILLAAPAGFLIASIAWILPNARGSEFW
jgi:formate/nitrite transporter FocA (FNT family)